MTDPNLDPGATPSEEKAAHTSLGDLLGDLLTHQMPAETDLAALADEELHPVGEHQVVRVEPVATLDDLVEPLGGQVGAVLVDLRTAVETGTDAVEGGHGVRCAVRGAQDAMEWGGAVGEARTGQVRTRVRAP